MSSAADALHHLVQVIRTGNEFYQHAADRIDDADLEKSLEANLADRRELLDRLQAVANVRSGTADLEEDLETRLEEERAEMEAVLESNDRYVYFNHLESTEERASQWLTDAREKANAEGDSKLRDLLEDMKPTFRRVQERMQSARDSATGREVPRTLATRIARQDRRT
ncbi:DUF2383 domain-containing protein [Proteobacteria bacterium 005FR1]|nr:DUF2383 domain-containing protein [Proteobacteria bacterium 005FR1]